MRKFYRSYSQIFIQTAIVFATREKTKNLMSHTEAFLNQGSDISHLTFVSMYGVIPSQVMLDILS